MELTQVRYFVALTRLLNFTRAADACNVSQPALTRAIQRLEDELGGPLVYRERNLTQLTELGRAMLPHLEAMLEAADNASALAEARRQQPVASLKIGLGPGVGAAAIAGAVREVASLMPDLMVRFEEAAGAMLVESMLSDMLDCAVLPADCALPERFNHWKLYDEGAVVVMPPQHRLANAESITASDLDGEVLLHGERCGGFVQALRAACDGTFRVRRCDGGIGNMLDLVSAGLGIAILSERMAVPSPLVTCRLAKPPLNREVRLAAIAGRPQGPAVAGFIKLCRAGCGL
ncbi:LysR family transcriptional regulator [Acidiphilium sp. C61]|jgi:DNA-binding transcriptional LysR family regulator|uniref:LysR family transcriptional regulator n=1 Tax=Acidiphilium sp. C61 TaxID=1671485 RepID=UPI00157B863E|nr:LysR family transcriptional regulator [Acidiphilium sp. C61]